MNSEREKAPSRWNRVEETQGCFNCVKGFRVSNFILSENALLGQKQAVEISEHKSEHLLQV